MQVIVLITKEYACPASCVAVGSDSSRCEIMGEQNTVPGFEVEKFNLAIGYVRVKAY
jgi:hypothetical protein